ncbi:MAG TPA: site-specific DNA-methyltransferase [Gemmatimonadaceae bacterium]|nr:site-specific DNA-methyltransferase [Gemmatimonadaceae bacterium]
MIDVSNSAHYVGDCRALLREMPDGCVQTCITSPPYWGLRDYGNSEQIGIEPTPVAYVAALVDVFCEVRRVLRDDGTLWLNLGDSYATNPGNGRGGEGAGLTKGGTAPHRSGVDKTRAGLKVKDLIGIPWSAAFALRDDGWWLRSDVIWSKPNPMPESVRDRPTKGHEYMFLLSKSASYYYDADAIAEPAVRGAAGSRFDVGKTADHQLGRSSAAEREDADTRNKRSVWTVASQPYDGAHFATFPPKLIEPCILAGSRPGDLVLDPFFGSGTTGMVAESHGRRWIGFDLGYAELAKERTAQRSLLAYAEREP